MPQVHTHSIALWFTVLLRASINLSGLTSLIGFPSFRSLRSLELQDNFLTASSGLDKLSVIAPSIRVLRLANNRIASPDALLPYLVGSIGRLP